MDDLLKLANMLNDARILANSIELVAWQGDAYGDTSEALTKVLYRIVGDRCDAAMQAILDGMTVTEAVEHVRELPRHKFPEYACQECGYSTPLFYEAHRHMTETAHEMSDLDGDTMFVARNSPATFIR